MIKSILSGNSDGEEKRENEHRGIRKSGSEARPGKVRSSAVCYRDDPKVNPGNRQCPETLRKTPEGRYELEVIDIYQQPKLAKGEQIIATPTLIKKLPLPLRKLIGDMSDTERFLVGIDLKPKNS